MALAECEREYCARGGAADTRQFRDRLDGRRKAATVFVADDLCRVMVDMATNDAATGEVFNITAEGVTANEYFAALSEIVGRPADIVYLNWMALEIVP